MICEQLKLKDAFPQLGNDGCDPELALYLPTNLSEMGRQSDLRPGILICPGGGYAMVSQREAEPIALKFLSEGYNVFVLTYSVAPHCFPTQLREVAAAMELIYQNAKKWHVDTGRIAIMGFSAGAHLSAHYSTAYDCPEVRQMFPDSKPVQASILCYPVITADRMNWHLGSIVNVSGHAVPTDEDVERFSCERLVTEKTPPAFLWHTAEDNVVPVMNSLLYAQALAAHNVSFALHIYPKGAHGLSTVDAMTNDSVDTHVALAHDWLDAAKKWLQITL